MARDKITIDLLIASKQAEREVRKINRQFRELERTASGITFGGRGGGDKVRALGTGLSKATVKADEFNKSLEASNARVIAFGASAGIIMQVDRALKAMVSSALKVEKAMADVNVVMNVSTRTLEKFGKGMFQVAKNTAQSFDTVAEAATELARQGLGVEKSLQRTSDALILTRLTGMNAADAVKSLTAAVNSFNKAGVTSSQVINKMAKVDQAFAVSSDDLAKAISRVGSSAVAAGVSMDELLAITTAVQQKTARGGAVIGNAFKTIFTRIQRTDVQAKLQAINVATRDMTGAMLPATQILQNLANEFGNLSKAQQANISENVAGVFQVNILKAALSDLSSEYQVYGRALKDSVTATDEAYRKNEELNKTLDSLVNRTLANLTGAGAAIGGATLEPAIRKVLNSVNNVIDAFQEGGRFESFGEGIGKNIMTGIGNFLSGPGLIMLGAAATKLFFNLSTYAAKAFGDVMGINNATKQRLALEEAVVATIASEPTLLAQVRAGTVNLLDVEQKILNTVKLANAERARMQSYAAPTARALYGRGVRTGPSGATLRGGPGSAGGFIPNFANAGAERAAAAAGGYRAGAIRTMSQPGTGTMMYNSAETVKRFPGMSQSAIMPPQGSAAGAGYSAAFSAAHGFNPYAASGFIPNFASTAKKRAAKFFNPTLLMNNTAKRDIGIIMGQGANQTQVEFSNTMKAVPQLADAILASGTYRGLMTGDPIKGYGSGRKLGPETKFLVRGVPSVSMFPMSQAEADRHASGQEQSTMNVLSGALNRYKNQVATKLWGSDTKASKMAGDFKIKRLSKGTAGDIFEEAVRASTPETASGKFVRTEAFDFDGPNYAPKQLIKFMNTEGANLLPKRTKIEAKIGNEAAKGGNMPKKIINDLIAKRTGSRVGPYAGQNGLFAALAGALYGTQGKALGFIPNFSPLSSAIGREMSAGVPASAIRVGSSPSLRSSGNPGGVGVYNTIDEPRGLGQGIARSRSMGINPKSHGAASGFVPNFMINPAVARAATQQNQTNRLLQGLNNQLGKVGGYLKENSAALMTASVGLSFLGTDQTTKLGAGLQAGTSTIMMGAMGGMVTGGPVGATIGAAVGLYSSMDMLLDAFSQSRIEMREFQTELARSAMVARDFSSKLDQAEQAFAQFASNYPGMTGPRAAEETGNLMALFTAADRAGGASGYATRGANLISKVQSGTYSPDDALELSKLISQARRDSDRQQRNQAFYGKDGWYQKMGDLGLFDKEGTTGRDINRLGRELGRLGGFNQRTIKLLSQNAGGAPISIPDIISMAGAGFQSLPTPARIRRGDFQGRSDMFEDKDILREAIADMRSGYILDQLTRVGKDTSAEAMRKEIAKAPKTITFDPLTDGVDIVTSPTAEREIRAKYDREAGKRFDQLLRDSFNRQFGGEKGLDLSVEAMTKSMSKGGAQTPDFGPLTQFGVSRRRASVLSGIMGARDARMSKMTNAEAEQLKQLERQGRLTRGRASMRRGAFSELQYDEAVGAAGDRFTRAERDAKADRTKALELLVKDIQKGVGEAALGGTQFQQLKTDDFIKSLEKMETSLLDLARNPEEFEKELVRLTTETRKSSDTQGIAGAKLKILNELYNRAVAVQGEFNSKTLEANQQKDADLLQAKLEKDIREKNIEALKQFYSEKFLEKLEEERTLLQGKLEFQKEELAAGRINIQAVNETTERLEVLNQTLDGTGQVFGQALEELKQAMFRPASPLQKQQAGAAAARKLGGTIQGRKLDAAGAQRLLKTNQVQGAFNRGLISADEYRSILEASRADATSASPGAVFREQFLYGSRDHMQEFEAGVVNVANTMKSSFAEAFKAISSGASSGKEAIVAFADGILNSISNVSANMATNMMFSRLFPQKADGGYIPRFAGGGVVTGGSGIRDDVPAMMSGGEYVIKKSSAQKIGYQTLDAINASGGGLDGGGQAPQYSGRDIATMYGISAAAGLASGAINQPAERARIQSQNYGLGRTKFGYIGGADPDAGGGDRVSGGGRSASVSLNKAFVYYRRDPVTGALVSERARPTEGRFETSSLLSTMGLLREDDPQTSRMFSKEQKMANYQEYLATEQKRRKDVLAAHDKMLRGRIIGAYVNAAMLVGGSYFMPGAPGAPAPKTAGAGPVSSSTGTFDAKAMEKVTGGVPMPDTSVTPGALPPARIPFPPRAAGGSSGASPALLMGGEYVMSPSAVRTHGVGFMSELNRGNVPGYAGGGLVGGAMVGGGAGLTTNNVKININVDKSGKADVGTSVDRGLPPTDQDDRDTNNEIENNKAMGKVLQGVVLQEIVKQQRPGGLLAK